MIGCRAAVWFALLALPHGVGASYAGVDAAITDAAAAWASLGRPTQGVHEADGWVFSCYQQAVDPASTGFQTLEIAACKQEALLQLVARCAGQIRFPESLKPPFRAIGDAAFANWYSGRLATAGVVWVHADRMRDQDVVVVALAATTCEAIGKQSGSSVQLREVAAQSESWIVTAAIAEIAGREDLPEVMAIFTKQFRQGIPPCSTQWPEALVKMPNGIPEAQLGALGLGELAQLARLRPGDLALWNALADRCKEVGLEIAAKEVQATPAALDWPKPAEILAPETWAGVDVADLPAELVAVVRSGGAVPAKPSAKDNAEKRATDAYAAKNPDLAKAEVLARMACRSPSPDALNLLAAIRLADPACKRPVLLQALAFSTQATVLDGSHPFARINALRAMQRLGWRDQVKAGLESLRPAEGAWQRREIERLSAWVRETDGQHQPVANNP
jgi:hypothetical protein